MSKLVDMVGMRFGALVVTSIVPNCGRVKFWECCCDCGTIKSIRGTDLRQKKILSCGCRRSSQGGMTRRHPMWRRWQSMIERCHHASNKSYENYGGRGIRVCDRWRTFENFLIDMEHTYFTGASLERINNDGNYEPRNVKWATWKEQATNRRPKRREKITEGQISQIFELRDAGLSIPKISPRVGVSSAHIWRILQQRAELLAMVGGK